MTETVVSVKYIEGVGKKNTPLVMFIGEAPGEFEDRLGEPFVGKSGMLLNKWINYLGFNRSDVYITNVVKVRPNNNRMPTEEEIKSWLSLLNSEIVNISPKYIVSLGKSAEKALQYLGISEFIVLYHPAYILRKPEAEEVVLRRLNTLKQSLNKREN